jgi:hypothetical protein
VSVIDGLMVIAALAAAVWWAFSRRRRPAALGRSLAGGLTFGSISAADMTAMTGETISAFAGPALGVMDGSSLDQVIARHPAIQSERRIAPKP